VLVAVNHLTDAEGVEATVDAVGGASAGSIVALCAAHSLVEGIDPVHLMREAWVEGVSLELLQGGASRAPLTFDRLRDSVPRLLDPRDEQGRPANRVAARQESPVILHVGLTGLQGLTYPIRGLREDSPVSAATYADWRRFELEPGGGVQQVVEPEGHAPLDYVLASSAHPGGFAPRILDRREDEEGYRSRGIDSFPESGRLWYTDGGLLQSQPLGRVLAAAQRPEREGEEAHHMNVLIDPRSEAPSASTHWSDPELEPTWQAGLARALAILPAQVLYEDLRRIEKDNSRLAWAEQLIDALAPHLDDGASDALREVIERIDEDRAQLRSDEPGRDGGRSDEPPDAHAVLRRAVAEIGGLRGKRHVEVDVISPLVLADGSGDVAGLLAGELVGDFGGFLSRDLRLSDFALGYESAVAWAAGGLRHCGLGDEVADRAAAAVEGARPYRWEDVKRGESGLGDLSMGARLQLGRLVLRAGRVLGSSIVDVRSRMPDPVGRGLDRARAALRRGG
jgi:predicted acylesterase/phospholipase RssA